MVEVRINCSESGRVGLGMTLTHMKSGRHLYDAGNDAMVDLAPNVVNCSRRFRLPDDTEDGNYNITVNLTKGKPGRSPAIDRYALSTVILKEKGWVVNSA